MVIRESAARKPKQQQQPSYIIFRDTSDKVILEEKGQNPERPGTIFATKTRQDSLTFSHDDRVVIGGGIQFSSPKHKASKKKTNKAVTKPKSTTSKVKQLNEVAIPGIVAENNQRIAELQFFENISQIEQNSKTLEDELREISRMQEREREIESTDTVLYSNPYNSSSNTRELPPRAVPQPALTPTNYLPEEQELIDWGRKGGSNNSQAPTSKPLLNGGNSMDASNLSEKELIELITQEIDQQEKKNLANNTKYPLAEQVPPPLTSCGFNAKKTNTLLPHENDRQQQRQSATTQNGKDERISEDEQNDGVLGVRNLTREERNNKKNLENKMKKNTVIATPIIRSGQISALEERTLRQRFENASLLSNNKNATYTFSPDTTTNSHLIKLPRRSKDDSYDSFEHHERYFGIIDEQGKARNNEQLLDASYSNKQLQKQIRQKQRKNERLQKDLETVRKPRRFSCPGSLGIREGFSFSDDAYNSDANTIDSIDETKTRFVVSFLLDI